MKPERVFIITARTPNRFPSLNLPLKFGVMPDRQTQRKKQMKNKIATIILGILLIGMVSAGLVTYLSNTITGSVEVEGPVFYANSERINLFGVVVKELSINTFNSSTACYTINDGEFEKFWTKKFDESISFYKPEIKMYVGAKIVSGEIPKSLQLIFGYYKGDDTYEICKDNVSVTSNDFNQYSVTCKGNSEISNLDGFYYEIKGMSTPNVSTRISLTNQETKAQVLGIAK